VANSCGDVNLLSDYMKRVEYRDYPWECPRLKESYTPVS
jgi:hypothetical protein